MDLNYAFGNVIGVKNNKLTGEYLENLEITSNKKERLINWLATMEKVPEEEVVKFNIHEVGPSKKAEVSHSADLKICISYDYKFLTKLIRQNKISASQILCILIIVGIQDSQLQKILNL